MVRQRLASKPLAEVREVMRSAFPTPGRTVTLPVADTAGRMTAKPVYSLLTVPEADIAARDGFAVESRETAGASAANPVGLENPQRVNTGNAIPAGYDAVVMIEDVAGRDGAWSTRKAVIPGEHLHPRGTEIRQGDQILPAGHRIRPCDIGALLSYGIAAIDVREVRVGLIPTGSELVLAGELPGPGGAVESNTAAAAALLGEAGSTCTRYGIVRDDPALLREAVEKGIRDNDLLLISAGSSAGTRDFTAGVIGDLGEVLVHGIAMKPGEPAIIGRIDGKPAIGLPGYPIAAQTAVRELALPLLVAWGFHPPPAERLRARLDRMVTSDPGYDEFVLLAVSRAGDRYAATPLPRGGGTQMAMVRANAYLHVPRGTSGICEGTEIEVLLTGPGREADEISEPAPKRPVQVRKESLPVKDDT
ncbi:MULTISPECIES: molybdenum cofactor synthesis domain-containing protein [Methanoculleus]|uniref:Molybdopterin molybdochelatase n=2 Tax=Methanoculleus TaxID=45989 RepID=A3CSF2_METMJ|nr:MULTISPECIES: molybdopterin-binding protein [Methanoculleus]ABN56302.1 molybdopterin molybdochelatase [Methanoculleus marisnigri JR1]UYU17754.1 molybdopterin-binding protein [Methanoculleus submarinus]